VKDKCLLASILLCAASSAFPAETLIWGITSFPPGYITDGPEKGAGYADQLDRFMMEKLPQYKHEIVVHPNWERQLRMMKQGPLVCTSIMWYRPPSKRAPLKGSYLLSAPNGVFFQHDVVVHKSKRHLFDKEVSFKNLLENQDLIFGYNRPYGITYNRILADYVGIDPEVELDAMEPLERLQSLRQARNIRVRTGTDVIGGMLKMLQTNRVDYILEYEFMVRYQQMVLGGTNELISIPVTEVKDQISRIAYACSDTPGGARAITAINKVLQKHRETKEFKKTLSYLVPRGREKRYWNAYREILNINQ